MSLYRRVEIVNGETKEPVAFVGVHPLKWARLISSDPDAAFVEDTALENLIDVVRDVIGAWYDDEQPFEVWQSLYDRMTATIKEAADE